MSLETNLSKTLSQNKVLAAILNWVKLIFLSVTLATGPLAISGAVQYLGAIPLISLCITVISFIASYIYTRRIKKQTYALKLTVLGMSDQNALDIAAQEYKDKTIGAMEMRLWENYITDNRQALIEYSESLNHLLNEKYSINPDVRPKGPIDGFPSNIKPDVYWYKNNVPIETITQDIYDGLMFRGEDGNPQYFTRDYCRKKTAHFQAFNKLFTGSRYPSPKRIAAYSLFWPSLILSIYGFAHVYIGPNIDLFLPSPLWMTNSKILIGLIYCLSIYWYAMSPELQANKEWQRRSKFTKIFAVLCLAFFIIYGVAFGLGKAWTEICGEEKTREYLVYKDPDTTKTAGRHAHKVKAYCIKSKEFQNAFPGPDEYCLQEAHYNLLPNGDIPMKFHGKESSIGFVINGYYISKNTD